MAKQATLINGLSAAVNLTGGAFDLGDGQVISMECVFSGGGSNLVGTLKLECSNLGVTWTEVTGSSQAITASASHVWNITSAQYRFVRPVWTFTSGTGNLTVTSFAKDLWVKGC